jgi:hypothetical protein
MPEAGEGSHVQRRTPEALHDADLAKHVRQRARLEAAGGQLDGLDHDLPARGHRGSSGGGGGRAGGGGGGQQRRRRRRRQARAEHAAVRAARDELQVGDVGGVEGAARQQAQHACHGRRAAIRRRRGGRGQRVRARGGGLHVPRRVTHAAGRRSRQRRARGADCRRQHRRRFARAPLRARRQLRDHVHVARRVEVPQQRILGVRHARVRRVLRRVQRVKAACEWEGTGGG